MIMSRTKYLAQNSILRVGFALDYTAWLQKWEVIFNKLNPEVRPFELPFEGLHPTRWSKEQIDLVNKEALQDIELLNHLLAIPELQFLQECEKLFAERIEKFVRYKLDASPPDSETGRWHHIVKKGILPYNLGMTHDCLVKIWDHFVHINDTDNIEKFFRNENPREFTLYQIEQHDAKAKSEKELYQKLLKLPFEEFIAECERLSSKPALSSPPMETNKAKV